MGGIAGLILAGVVLLGLVALGIVLLMGRGTNLIAGYNTMSDAEKAGWNVKTLCRFMGLMVLIFAATMALLLVGAIVEIPWLLYVGIAGFCAAVVFTLVYVNTSKRFRNKPQGGA